MTINERINELRHLMKKNSIDAIIIPSGDPHQSEYVADHWRCREWISAFSGSAGTVVVTHEHAGLWTDSRYFIQAEQELAGSEFILHKVLNYNPDFIPYILENLSPGSTVACDAKVFSNDEILKFKQQLDVKEMKVATEFDLVGEIWKNRPPIPKDLLIKHDIHYAGKSVGGKIDELRKRMGVSGADKYLLTALDDISWLFNLRGTDIEFNPVFYAFALIGENDACLYLDQDKVSDEIENDLSSFGVKLGDYSDVYNDLETLSTSTKLYLTGAGVNYKLFKRISCKIVEGKDLVADMKAIKNETEISHFKKVMEKDAVALIKLYRWLDEVLDKEEVTEFGLSEKLASFRAEQDGYFGESFAAIAGYAGNGAIVHYRPMPDTSALIKREGILLLDSGGQYIDGTTDITRTVALGSATDVQKKHFTLVLKGYIAIDVLEFPEGINGYQLDAFARQHLWNAGLNYYHGTGHGVGFFLNVHEGPHGISFVKSERSLTPLEPGMVTSNEPGFYREGEYGIRIENLILTKVVKETEFGKFLGHETLTLFPIDKALIESSLLTKSEVEWINKYHKMVFDRVSPYLDMDEKAWLEDKCKSF